MELSSFLAHFNGIWVEDALFWTIAGLAGITGLVAVVNALDLFFEAETETQ